MAERPINLGWMRILLEIGRRGSLPGCPGGGRAADQKHAGQDHQRADGMVPARRLAEQQPGGDAGVERAEIERHRDPSGAQYFLGPAIQPYKFGQEHFLVTKRRL